MPSEATSATGVPLPAWGEVVRQAAERLDLRCANLNAAMAAGMGIPHTDVPDREECALILWNTERRPIFAYRTPGDPLVLSAKVLQPAIQFGLGAETTDGQIESMSQMVQGIAVMVGEGRVKVTRRRNDIEAVRELDGSGPLDGPLITAALRDLMTVQNLFRQWLDGELTGPIMDFIALNYALSKAP